MENVILESEKIYYVNMDKKYIKEYKDVYGFGYSKKVI